MEKAWNIETHDVISVSFYPDESCKGGALRENYIFMCKRGDHTNRRYLNAAQNRARKLHARSFKMWKCIPRSWGVYYPEDDE